jgi:hypothetical protein
MNVRIRVTIQIESTAPQGPARESARSLTRRPARSTSRTQLPDRRQLLMPWAEGFAADLGRRDRTGDTGASGCLDEGV